MELSGTKVMVVEDDALVSMLLEENLRDLGCEVVAISDRLDDALDKAGKETMDVVMLDINLAGTLSYPVAELSDFLRVRRFHSHPPLGK
jgi:CheY-like chemotaxis protein